MFTLNTEQIQQIILKQQLERIEHEKRIKLKEQCKRFTLFKQPDVVYGDVELQPLKKEPKK